MACGVCRSKSVDVLIDYGRQPITNRFLARRGDEEALFPLGLSQCRACGLIQLTDPAPAREHKPPYDWLKYYEAEGHLDRMVGDITKAVGLAEDATVIGLTYKEQSTLDRIGRTGHRRLITLDPVTDLGLDDPCAGIETIQERVTPQRAARVVQRHGKADLVVVRHVLEHAHDPHTFVAGLLGMLKPGGHLVLEVPDFATALESFDYSYVWEEHMVYFTPGTFPGTLPLLGLHVVFSAAYPYPVESCLMAVSRPAAAAVSPACGKAEIDRAARFAKALPDRKRALRDKLEKFRRANGPIAVFGAGHLAAKFINLMGVADLIEFVIDDHPAKKGLYMPGSRLPIVGSDSLFARGIKLCLLSLKPESEAKVVRKYAAFTRSGGVFSSMFPASPTAFKY